MAQGAPEQFDPQRAAIWEQMCDEGKYEEAEVFKTGEMPVVTVEAEPDLPAASPELEAHRSLDKKSSVSARGRRFVTTTYIIGLTGDPMDLTLGGYDF